MYPSDLTDKQWSRLSPLLNEPRVERHAGGRPRKHEQRRVVDALLYVVKTGCQWRQLPSNFPPWKTVHEHFRSWRDSGVWELGALPLGSSKVTSLTESRRTRHNAKNTRSLISALPRSVLEGRPCGGSACLDRYFGFLSGKIVQLVVVAVGM